MTHKEAVNDLNTIKEFFEQESGAYPISLDYAIKVLKNELSLDRPQGEWIGYNADKGGDWLRDDGTPVFLVCDKCYGTVINNGSAHWDFCPNCGARMKGLDDDTI